MEKLGLGLTAFVLIKPSTTAVTGTAVCQRSVANGGSAGFWRMAGEYDYLLRVQVADMKRYDDFINVW